MPLVIDPAFLIYLEDLKSHGAGYHTTMDFLDLVDINNPQAREHKKVSIFSPCFSLELWRSFYDTKIVGVKFEQPVAMCINYQADIYSIKNAETLLAFCEKWLADWTAGKALHLPFSAERLAKARSMHERAHQFFREHSDSANIPPAVHKKMVVVWKLKSSPSALSH